MCADDYWSTYAFTNSTYPELLGYVELPNQLPDSCSAWNSSGNTALSYGDVIAYPATRLQAKCHALNVYQQNNIYSCEEDPLTQQLVISNFWSTTAVNDSTNVPLSHVLVDVFVLDNMDQKVSTGEFEILRHTQQD